MQRKTFPYAFDSLATMFSFALYCELREILSGNPLSRTYFKTPASARCDKYEPLWSSTSASSVLRRLEADEAMYVSPNGYRLDNGASVHQETCVVVRQGYAA